MTIQLVTTRFNKSKRVLQDALNDKPTSVHFEDPSIFAPRSFTGDEIKVGEKFPIVMDHPKRMRFATVQRVSQDFFKVS